jgi:hypothetical protein
MNLNNPPKFYGIVLLIICLTTLVGVGRVSWDDAVPLYTGIMGYLVGNGIAAYRDEPVTPAIGRKNRGQ